MLAASCCFQTKIKIKFDNIGHIIHSEGWPTSELGKTQVVANPRNRYYSLFESSNHGGARSHT